MEKSLPFSCFEDNSRSARTVNEDAKGSQFVMAEQKRALLGTCLAKNPRINAGNGFGYYGAIRDRCGQPL